ncbi:MAG: hypothetical protein OXU34_04790 [Gammaproteobacteria bacterium]|nr:hypothetical protein [Gammaproteobacteria bacterium]
MDASDDAALLARLKRVKERWIADEAFRDKAARGWPAALEEYHLAAPETLARAVLGPYGRDIAGSDAHLDREQQQVVRRFFERESSYLDFVYNEAGRFDGCRRQYLEWRRRQTARNVIARGYFGLTALYLPFAVELSDGCSVGCWFCGLSPDKFRGHREATPQALREWRQVLRAMHGMFGRYAQRGFLYWATDPLDNPDYEVFADVFAEELGRWPATTTSLAAKDLERTRALIERGREKRTPSSRFSITTLKMQDKIHRYFSAEELHDVDMVPVNKGSFLGLAQAGGVLTMAEKQPQRAADEKRKLENIRINLQGGDWDSSRQHEYVHETICCVAGFLVNLVKRSVELITTVKASHLYPKGYEVLESATWDDAAQFSDIADGMVRRQMATVPPGDGRLVLHPAVEYRADDGGCWFESGRGYRERFESPSAPGLHAAVADALRVAGNPESVAPVAEIRRRVSSGGGHAPALVGSALRELWQAGVLVEPGWARLETAR